MSERRTFGILPGRARLRNLRTHVRRIAGVVRARLVSFVEIALARGEAWVDRFPISRHRADLRRERFEALAALGETVLRGDEPGVERAKARVSAIDGRLGAVEDGLRQLDDRMRRRVARAQREGGRTEIAEPAPSPVPGPEPVPEPGPVPSDPPGPVVVPEREPVPSEPPGPVIVPEPEAPVARRAARRR